MQRVDNPINSVNHKFLTLLQPRDFRFCIIERRAQSTILRLQRTSIGLRRGLRCSLMGSRAGGRLTVRT